MAGRRLSRVHSGRQKDKFFTLKHLRVTAVREYISLMTPLRPYLIAVLDPIERRYRDDFDFATFKTVAQDISLEVDIGLILQFLLNFVHLLNGFLIWKGIRKSEISDLVLRIVELVTETHLEVWSLVVWRCIRVRLRQRVIYFLEDAPPFFAAVVLLFLGGRQHAEHWPQTLAVEFALLRWVRCLRDLLGSGGSRKWKWAIRLKGPQWRWSRTMFCRIRSV